MLCYILFYNILDIDANFVYTPGVDCDISYSLVGHVLVTHPVVQDKFFKKTVILVGDDNSTEVTGVILNRPYFKLLRDIDSKYQNSNFENIPIYRGGDNEKDVLTLVAWLYQRRHLELYYSITFEEAANLKKENPHIQLRGFLGYVALPNVHRELERGLWISYKADELLGLEINSSKLWASLVSAKCPNAVI